MFLNIQTISWKI